MNHSNSPCVQATSSRRLRSMLTLALVLSATSVLWMPPAQAQAPDDASMTKEQETQLRRLLQGADAKVNAGFKGQEKLQEDMLSELKAIESLKDPLARNKAIGAYQEKHKKAYGEILTKGGLSLQDLANQIQPVFPNLIVQVTDKLTIIGRSRQRPLRQQSVSAAPTAVTREIEPGEFEVHKEKSCALAAGGDVTSTNTSITATSLAVVAGGCHNRGDMTASVQLPPNRKSASIRVEADLSAVAFAAGVGTAAASTGSAHASIFSCGNQAASASAFVMAIAPFAWVASEEEEVDGAQRVVAPPAAATECLVRASSSAITVSGVIGASSARGSAKRFKASVTIEN